MTETTLTLTGRSDFADLIRANRHDDGFREQVAGCGGVREAWSILAAGGWLVFGGGAPGAEG